MNLRSSKYWLSLIPVAGLAAFFFLRDLGTFPAAWIDDSLYMITAKELAAGHGIAIPILGELWINPPILHVGYPFLIPIALAIKTMGFSIESARIPMVLFMTAFSILSFIFTYKTLGKWSAWWSLLLLITLSAFVNTGKPTLGEIPAMTFLVAGLLCFPKSLESKLAAIGGGLLFGFSILSKDTFVLILTAFFAVLIYSSKQRKRKDLMNGVLSFLIALILFSSWKMLEIDANGMNLLSEYSQRLIGGDNSWHFLGGKIGLLFTLPYATFAGFFVLGLLGFLQTRKKMNHSLVILYGALVLLFILYFLTGPGWYRHLLPAHLLLLPFVPKGLEKIMGVKTASLILCLMVLAQGWWQFTYKGSSKSTEAEETAAILERDHTTTPLIIRQAEVYVRLTNNTQWVYYPHETLALRLDSQFQNAFEEESCTRGQIIKMNDEALAIIPEAKRIVGPYVYLPPKKCQ